MAMKAVKYYCTFKFQDERACANDDEILRQTFRFGRVRRHPE